MILYIIIELVMSDLTKYTSIVSIITSIIVGVYVYREFSYTRAKMGEIKFLKNQFINLEARIGELEERQDKIDSTKKIVLSDSENSSSDDDYDVFDSSDDEYEEGTPVVEEIILNNE